MNPYQEIIRATLGHPDLSRSAILLYLAVAEAGGEGRVSKLAKGLQMPRTTAVLAASDLVTAGLCTRASGTVKIKQFM